MDNLNIINYTTLYYKEIALSICSIFYYYNIAVDACSFDINKYGVLNQILRNKL